MNLKSKDYKNITSIIVLLLGMNISLNILDGLVFDILGVAFFIGFAYGVVSYKKERKFIF